MTEPRYEPDPRDALPRAIADLLRREEEAKSILVLVPESERSAVVQEIANCRRQRAEFTEILAARDVIRLVR